MGKQQTIWRHLWEIPNCNYHMVSIPLLYWPTEFKKMGAGDQISKILVICRKRSFEGLYDPEEFSSNNNYIFNKMKINHSWVRGNFKKIIKYNNDWIKISKIFLCTDFRKLSDKRLVVLAKKFFQANKNAHVFGLPITYDVDAEELVTKYLINYLDKLIQLKQLNLNSIEVFSILSSPVREGNIIKENRDSLKICLLINQSKPTQKLFKGENTEYIIKHLDKIEKKIKKAILKHYEKWRWFPYNYEGPAWNLDYFIDIWRGLIKQGINFKKELLRIKKNKKELLKKKKELYRKLEVDKLHRFLLWCTGQIVYLKGFRKDVHYFACYCQENFWRELGRRLNLTMRQCRQILAWEIKDAVLKKKFNPRELNQRWKFSIMYADRNLKNGYKIYLGKEAKKFLAKQKFEKMVTKGIIEIHGSCAEAGKVRGKIKIINAKEDMRKMKNGDILVAANTSPDLLPAMKKAAAIISDQGGLTCHAAIVSRELKIPCVVGTKFATKILKDGDYVMVNATKGIIKKLK